MQNVIIAVIEVSDGVLAEVSARFLQEKIGEKASKMILNIDQNFNKQR